MSENIEQEHLENPTNAESENPSDEITAITPKETINSTSETEKMEVHHHPQLHHNPKPWKEYFLEFLMIFLAVTLGFFAENMREHISEEKTARQFLENYHNELQQQAQQIINFEDKFKKKLLLCDSIVQIYNNGEENKKLNYLANSTLRAKQILNIPFNTSVYEQMISSGAFRYITNVELKDSINSYKNQIELAKAYNNDITDAIIKNTFEIGKIEDLHDLVSADTSSSYDLSTHIPTMKPFQKLMDEQRRQLITFYVFYMAQAQSNLHRLRIMYVSNKALVEIINKELNK